MRGAKAAGRSVRTTIPDAGAQRPADLVNREFHAAAARNVLWVVDFERHEALSNGVGVGDLRRRAVAAVRTWLGAGGSGLVSSSHV